MLQRIQTEFHCSYSKARFSIERIDFRFLFTPIVVFLLFVVMLAQYSHCYSVFGFYSDFYLIFLGKSPNKSDCENRNIFHSGHFGPRAARGLGWVDQKLYHKKMYHWIDNLFLLGSLLKRCRLSWPKTPSTHRLEQWIFRTSLPLTYFLILWHVTKNGPLAGTVYLDIDGHPQKILS